MDGQAQDITVNSREAIEFVILSVFAKGDIDLAGMLDYSADQALAESPCRGTQSSEGVEILQIGNPGPTAEVALVEKLNGGLTAFASYSHDVG